MNKSSLNHGINSLVSLFSSIQACIKPVEKKSEEEIPEVELNKQSSAKRVQVSLTDCLACSGCITSAESVLISSQSHDEFKRVLDLNRKNRNSERMVVVVSMSHQSIASFATKYGLSFQEAAEKLVSFLKNIGVDFVFDLTLARHISLIEACREFQEKVQKFR